MSTPARPAAGTAAAAPVPVEDLHDCVRDPVLDSMSLLNEIASRYPGAISFAPGWPPDDQFTPADIGRYVRQYADYLVTEYGLSPDAARQRIFQYGPSSGIICDLVARYLATTENITVSPQDIVITTGCQEAMVITLRGLFARADDVLLVPAPCYFGIIGAARILGISTEPVPEGPDGLRPQELTAASRRVRAAGRRPRALYLIPDFANPSGATLSQPARDGLRAAAAAERLLILEDNPYGFFTRTGSRRPALKARDDTGSVIYLGSFAKTCFPGTRIGYIVADQQVTVSGRPAGNLAAQLTKIKTMITINTSPVTQAVVGGMLIASGFTLADASTTHVQTARQRMNTMLTELGKHFRPLREQHPAVSWNQPDGGFFAVLQLPVTLDLAALETSAARHGVLWTPMSLFYPRGGEHQMRLAASYATPEQISTGIERLARFAAERLGTRSKRQD